MTRKEKLDALLAGKTLVTESGESKAFYDLNHYRGPFVWEDAFGECFRMAGAWDAEKLTIQKAPKMRYMTRDEVITFIVYHPYILVSREQGAKFTFPQFYSFIGNIADYEYIEVAPDGTHSEIKKFMVEDKP